MRQSSVTGGLQVLFLALETAKVSDKILSTLLLTGMESGGVGGGKGG